MRTRLKICLRATSFADLTWTVLGANHGLHVKKPAINSQSYGSRYHNWGDLQSMSLHCRYWTVTGTYSRCAVLG
jgi:hypothetical protein